jgi:hypothetical protein
VRLLSDAKKDFVFVHTGQHYDYNMSLQFIKELELPKPDIGFPLRARNPDEQVAFLTRRVGAVLRSGKISAVLVEGDTNSVLAGALAANKLRIHKCEGLGRSLLNSSGVFKDMKTMNRHNCPMVLPSGVADLGRGIRKASRLRVSKAKRLEGKVRELEERLANSVPKTELDSVRSNLESKVTDLQNRLSESVPKVCYPRNLETWYQRP